jgi:hypothetical protein
MHSPRGWARAVKEQRAEDLPCQVSPQGTVLSVRVHYLPPPVINHLVYAFFAVAADASVVVG